MRSVRNSLSGGSSSAATDRLGRRGPPLESDLKRRLAVVWPNHGPGLSGKIVTSPRDDFRPIDAKNTP